jgi:hypothetical protein
MRHADCRRRAAWIGAAGVALVFAACGGSPNGPGPVTPPPGGGGITPPPNAVPTIQSVAIHGTRSKEPENFADVGEVVNVTADVKDAETPISQLQFNWSAPVGTFSGTGASVTWQAPAQVTGPTDVVLTLEVVERYGTAPNMFEHRVSSTAALSLHDSIKEVGDMARQFLLDFSDSSIRNVDYIMRNFQPGCYGTADETAQVTENRRRYQIVQSQVGDAKTTINFGGSCYAGHRGDACTSVSVLWRSIDLDKANAVGTVTGTDWIASMYVPAQKRWWLCDSAFEGRQTIGSTFIR